MQLFLVAINPASVYTLHREDMTMGQKEKLIQRLKSKPKDFTFDDAEILLNYLEFTRSNKGKTSGSRVIFVSEVLACKKAL